MKKDPLVAKSFLILYFLLAFFWGSSLAQKPCIDTGAANKWPVINGFQVSNNGKYFYYYVTEKSKYNLILEPTSLKWKMTLAEAGPCAFTQNSEKVLIKRNDSLAIIDLDADRDIYYVTDINDFELVKFRRNNDLLVYSLKGMPDELIVSDMETRKERRFSNVQRYWHSADGNVFVLETKNKKDSIYRLNLSWVEISNDSVKEMWEGRNIETILLGEEGLQCIFSADANADSNMGIWFYQRSDKTAQKIIDDQSNDMEKGFDIEDITTFNERDKRVFFTLKKRVAYQPKGKIVPVDIWSYKDARLQSAQLLDLQERVFYKAALNLLDRKVIRLENDNERILSPIYTNKTMKYVLIAQDGGGDVYDEWNWNSRCLGSIFLMSLDSGTRRIIGRDLSPWIVGDYLLSYNEHYVFYYDAKSRNYCSYSISDNIRRNLTSSLRGHWIDRESADWPDSSFSTYQVARVIKDEDAVVVYDQHSIYELDPAAKTPAVNLAGFHQGSENLEIRLLGPSYSRQYLERHQPVILSVFNYADKREALFKSDIDSLKYWKGFQLQPYYFENLESVKARDTDLYFVTRMTAEESPNVYMTSNFSTYQSMTDVFPEKAYNWMKSELITWKTLDGRMDQGILYKPENFDSRKTYPMLVYYYERLSDGLHRFLAPKNSEGPLNIPTYVSNGYMVFVPDIHYTIGWPGRSACDAVFSGVKYLSRYKYIDINRIGLQGHSFGGFETNYIITHSHLFAAAMSASGMTDFISAYGSIVGDGTSRQRQYELYRDRIGATLWQKPSLYLENSPVLRADKVTTPLLMMTDKEDDDVPYQQGIEFFTALRRLGKKVWMLQYDGQGHNVDGVAAEDLTIRMQQFFNYYLKSETPPKWMTKGVPAKLKGIDSGLELDTSREKP